MMKNVDDKLRKDFQKMAEINKLNNQGHCEPLLAQDLIDEV